MQQRDLASIVKAIQESGLSIYDSLDSHPELILEASELQEILSRKLIGLNLDFPLRTRSKVLKSAVCESLGYPVPDGFQKTQPRFPGQNFDTYIQKANNLQIWNEEVTPSRRYVLIRVDDENIVVAVKVVTGDVLESLDRTGTLTQKFQAKSKGDVSKSLLVSKQDTEVVRLWYAGKSTHSEIADKDTFVPITKLFESLQKLCGTLIPNPGIDQERNRGAELHRLICDQLPGTSFSDSGQFPDIPSQILEVKLQTSPTIDLGLVCPDSHELISPDSSFKHSDVRYAVFYGSLVDDSVRIDSLVLSTGKDFFSFFTRFEGKVKNKKIQIPLPRDFF